jgi:hypothetical protein
MHSAERTLSEVKVRSPLRVSQECTALVARIIGIADPLRPLGGRSARCGSRPRAPPPRPRPDARASPSRSASPAAGGKVQSISTTASPNCFDHLVELRVATKGLSSTRISVWLLSWSSTFLRLPNRVLRLITRCSRKLSIGGLVTWLKFCRKKWLSGRYWSTAPRAACRRPSSRSPPCRPRPWARGSARAPRSNSRRRPGAAQLRALEERPLGHARRHGLEVGDRADPLAEGLGAASRSLISASW